MNEKPRSYLKLWLALAGVIALSFVALGYFGREIYYAAPPIPQRVVTPDGTVLFTAQNIKDGQNVWQSIGGQEVGTVWGHGAYVVPDWSAVHGHAALFGVYGMLGIGLMLFCLRCMTRQEAWKTGVLNFSFWALNLGLKTGWSLEGRQVEPEPNAIAELAN
jgi:nitric oxide reductase large subunit